MKKVFWNKQDLCEVSGQSLSTINNWIRKGMISFIKVGEESGRGAVLFDPDTVTKELKNYMRRNESEEQLQETTQEKAAAA